MPLTMLGGLLASSSKRSKVLIAAGVVAAAAYRAYSTSSSSSSSSSSKSKSPQKHKSSDAAAGVGKDGKLVKKRVAVDRIFFRRLAKIMRILIPSYTCVEFRYFMSLTVLLLLRSGLSVYITSILGRNAQALVRRDWPLLKSGISTFAVVTVPASAINSLLKYFTAMLSLSFRRRLSEHVHAQYLEGVNFYKACNLGGENRIDNADQRVTADIEMFSREISELYTTLFKPVLDLALFTYKLGQILGWQGPSMMYAYFVFSAIVKKKLMPRFGRLVAKQSNLEGDYRSCHNRLITHSEEIAFYDGCHKEKTIITGALDAVCEHNRNMYSLQGLVNTFDGLLVKYYASICGYCVLASPLIFGLEKQSDKTVAELTNDYIRNSRYLGALSTAVGELVLVGNKLTSISGYTSRVSELLELVGHLNTTGNRPFKLSAENAPDGAVTGGGRCKSGARGDGDDADRGEGQSSEDEKEVVTVMSPDQLAALSAWCVTWHERCDAQREARITARHSSTGTAKVVGGGEIVLGDYIHFDKCDIVSPDGTLLVKELCLEVRPGVNVMVTGPNGAGKSSLFRIIGELWPLSSGRLLKPRKEDVLFVPQKPYLVMGTLRDQIIYPHSHADMKSLGVSDDDLKHLLAIVDPAQLIVGSWNWDDKRDWFRALSGGQKQRVAMARLFYHKPKFAILDECTSAVSDDVENKIYETCRMFGITIFTVSHRKSLARHHDHVLAFDGRGSYTFKQLLASENYAY